MLAVYPGTGARFQRHVDNTAADGRRLTVLCYMNASWGPDDGGELCVHPAAGPVLIPPLAGRLALFHADSMPHEVLPSRRHRYSVNVWYYDAEERDRAAAEARAKGRIGPGGPVSVSENAAARAFLQQLLGGGAATAAEIERLALAAELLPAGAAPLVAEVTMGSLATPHATPGDVAAALRAMPPSAVDTLRSSLSMTRTVLSSSS